MITRTYLGDGVYFDEGPIDYRLVTSDGIRDTNVIYLEPEVLLALQRKIDEVLKSLTKA